MFHKKSWKYKACLVTWEWIGDHAKRDDKIVAVLDPRWKPAHVREFVEVVYLNLTYSIGERMYYALHRRKNPYPAKYVDSTARWPPVIHCGHNPFLMAHLVEELQVEIHDDWMETATWRTCVRDYGRRSQPRDELLGDLALVAVPAKASPALFSRFTVGQAECHSFSPTSRFQVLLCLLGTLTSR